MSDTEHLLRLTAGGGIGSSVSLSDSQWKAVAQAAHEQCLTGLLAVAICEMPPSMRPPLEVRVTVALAAEQIAANNELLDRHCEEITSQLRDMGLESCVLKGQGFARLYPHPEARICGDIDLWVRGKAKDTLPVLRRRWKTGRLCYHHTDIRPFNDRTEVEVHFRPSWMNDPFVNRRLQRYFSGQEDRQFHNCLHNLDFNVTTSGFNCVFCVVHIYRHLLTEGIGLRQITDCRQILRNSSAEDRAEAAQVLAGLKMKRFTGALMYVLQRWLYLDEKFLIIPVDEKRGRFLMNEIVRAGNFGQYDTRYDISDAEPLLVRTFKKMIRLSHFVGIAPFEVFWAPFFKVWQYLWRLRINGTVSLP